MWDVTSGQARNLNYSRKFRWPLRLFQCFLSCFLPLALTKSAKLPMLATMSSAAASFDEIRQLAGRVRGPSCSDRFFGCCHGRVRDCLSGGVDAARKCYERDLANGNSARLQRQQALFGRDTQAIISANGLATQPC